jgi:hypothetical protein
MDDVEAAHRQAVGDVARRMAETRARAGRAVDLAVALGAADERDAAQVCAAFLEQVMPESPEFHSLYGRLREDAEFWADCASPPVLEAFVAAGLRQIGRQAFAERARKRLFAALWETFSEEDRRAFVMRVDPHGRFRGRSA